MTTKILEGPKLKTTIPQKSIGQLIFDCTKKYGELICQIDGATGASETFSSVKTRSIRVAIELAKKGINSKDVVAFWSKNTLDAVIPMIATFFLGAKVAFLIIDGSSVKEHLASLRPKIIFVELREINFLEECLKEINLNLEIIVYDEHPTRECLSHLTKPKNQLEEENFKPVEVNLDDVSNILCSSGSTGISKISKHTHRNYINIGYILKEFDLGPSVLHLSSLAGTDGHYSFLTQLLTGRPRIFLSSINDETFFKTIEKFQVSTVLLNPFRASIFADSENYKNFDLTSLSTIYCGGANLNLKLYQKLSAMFPEAEIISWYGTTETMKLTGLGPKFYPELYKKQTLSCGVPLYGMKIKIVDLKTGDLLGPDEIGEIRVVSPCFFKGYYNTDNTNIFDKDGFFKTGDLGYYDEDKCIYFVDRMKWTFSYKSSVIIPSIIETVLLEHPAIKEAVVFGRPWGEDGDAPTACVVLEDDAQITEKEIEVFVAGKVSDDEKLRGGIFIVKQLLRNISGKYLKADIKNTVLEKI